MCSSTTMIQYKSQTCLRKTCSYLSGFHWIGPLSLLLLPSTQAGLALVVPAIWPFLQAQRAVCLAMVRRGWLLSLSSVTISHVPAASWPGNDIAPQNVRSERWNDKQGKINESVSSVKFVLCHMFFGVALFFFIIICSWQGTTQTLPNSRDWVSLEPLTQVHVL